ncbi:hypothetical protein PVMG_05763 [Plasmodium vivax Mauritania I]|uniref:VIR protein n=1 Tax=Plasmodium vivax Mauritania I TaxID=1035515 RepID=A0A0J9TJR9_PLAVI|nr:hypothetical protein PVMG_05763 [Plasmodium vivax Mauritania I]
MTKCNCKVQKVKFHFFIVDIYNEYKFKRFLPLHNTGNYIIYFYLNYYINLKLIIFSFQYIDYNCYDCLSYRFPRCTMTEDGLDYLNNALNLIKPKIPNFTASNEFLKSIVTHLICNRVFMHVDTNIACNYINFWLNKKVKDLYYYEFDSNFKNFKEFVNKFYTVVKGDYKSYKSCTNSIQILGNEDYYQMNMLYSLFKEYDELKKINEWEYKVKNTCDIISKITNLANDVARKYKKDEEFIKVLKNLRETIKNAEGSYKTFCKSDLKQLDNMVTEREFPSIVHAPPTRQEILKPSDSLEQTTHQSLAHVSGNGIRNEPEPNVNLQASSRTVQLSSGEHITKVSHAMLPSEAQQHRGLSPAVSHHAGDSHEDRIEPSPFSVEQYEQSRDAHSSPEYTGYNSVSARFATGDVITSTQGAQSYLENIRGTITGVFQSVEPAPILGVSGGMGVLFLLFKVFNVLKLYTHVCNTFK